MNTKKKSENLSRVRMNSEKQQKCVKKKKKKCSTISTKNNELNKISSASPSNEQKEKLTLTICFNSKENNERETCFVKKNVKYNKTPKLTKEYNYTNNSPLSDISDSDFLIISEGGSKSPSKVSSVSDSSEINQERAVNNKNFINHDTQNSNEIPTLCFNNHTATTFNLQKFELDFEPLIVPFDFIFNKYNEFNIAMDVLTLKAASDYIQKSFSDLPLETIDLIQPFGTENVDLRNNILTSSNIGENFDYSNNPDINENILPSNSEDAESNISLISCNTNDIQLDFFDMPYEETIENSNYYYSNTNLKKLGIPLQEQIFDSDIGVASNETCIDGNENIEVLNPLVLDYCDKSSKGKRKRNIRYTKKCKFNKESSNINSCSNTISNNETCDSCSEKYFRNEPDKDYLSKVGNSESTEAFVEIYEENGKIPVNSVTLPIEINKNNDNKQNIKKRKKMCNWDTKKQKCNKKDICIDAKDSQNNEPKFKIKEIHHDTCEEGDPNELSLGKELETINLLESENTNIFTEANSYDKFLPNCESIKTFNNCESKNDQESVVIQQFNNSSNVESLKSYNSFNTRSFHQSNSSDVKDSCNATKIFKKKCNKKNKPIKVKSMKLKDFELENREILSSAYNQNEHCQSVVNCENGTNLSKLEEKEILKSNSDDYILFNTEQAVLSHNSNDDNVRSFQESPIQEKQKNYSVETIMSIKNSKSCIQPNASFPSAVNNTSLLLPADQKFSCCPSDESTLNIDSAKPNKKNKSQESENHNSTNCINIETFNKQSNSSINENIYQRDLPFLNTVSSHSTSKKKKCLELNLKGANKEQDTVKKFLLNDMDKVSSNREGFNFNGEKSNENTMNMQLNRKLCVCVKKLKLPNCDNYGTFKIKDLEEKMNNEKGFKKMLDIANNETNINNNLFNSLNHRFHSPSKKQDTKQPHYLKNNSHAPVECCAISSCHNDNKKNSSILKSKIEKKNISQPFQTDNNTISRPKKSHDSTKNSKDAENESCHINSFLLETPKKKTSISKSVKNKKCIMPASSLPDKKPHKKYKIANKAHNKVESIVKSNLNITNSPIINSSNSTDNLLNNILKNDNSDPMIKPTSKKIFNEMSKFESENSNTNISDSCKAVKMSKNKKNSLSKGDLNSSKSKNVSKCILGKKNKVLKLEQANNKNRKKTNANKSVTSKNKLNSKIEDSNYIKSDNLKSQDSIINNLKSPNKENKYDSPKKELNNSTNSFVLVVPPNINNDLNNKTNFTTTIRNMKRIPKLSRKKEYHTSTYIDEISTISKEKYCISSNSPEKSNIENKETNIKVPVNYTSPEIGTLQEDLDFEPDLVDNFCIEDLPSSSQIKNSSNSGTSCSFENNSTSQNIVNVLAKNCTSKNIEIDLYSDSNIQTLDNDLGNTPKSIPCLNYPDNFQIISEGKEFLSEDDSDSDHEHSFKRLYREKNNCEQPAKMYSLNENNVGNTLQINELVSENEIINNEVTEQDISHKKNKSFSSISREKLNNQDFTSPIEDPKNNKTMANSLITKTENPLGHSYRLEDVLIKINDFCNEKSIDEAVKITQTHIPISSNVINTLLINELFNGLLKLIDVNDLNIEISIINAFDQILKIVNDYNICNKTFLSNFIIKCCSYQALQMFSIKMFYICQNKELSINNKAIKDFGSYLQHEEVSIPVIINFLDYVKTVCNRNRPKELVHLALEKCKQFKFSYSHTMCLCLHNISFKEIDPANLEEFLKICFQKNMWANIADLFVAWDTHYELLELLYVALVSDYRNASYYFKKFTDYLWEQHLSFGQKNFIGQIGTSLMIGAFSLCELQCALDVLYILHALNINYFELQLRGYESYITGDNIDIDNFEIKAFPYLVVFIAVDLCLNFERYKDAFTIFQGVSWFTPDKSLDAQLKSLIINQRFQRLLKLVPHLNSDVSLNEGVEALKVLLITIEQDLSQKDIEENAKGLQTIFNQYLITLINNQKISSVKDLCQYIVGPCKDVLSLNSAVLRGLIVTFSENSMIEEATNLFMMGLVKKTYSIEKPQHNSFPWHMTIMTNWTIHEIKLAVEWFLEILFPLLTEKPSNTDFEKWFSVKIVFKIGNQNNSNIHCLENVSSTIENGMKKTCEALEQMKPSLKVIHEVAEENLKITSDSLYNCWKDQFPNAAKLTPFISCLETKEKKISFGKSPVSTTATQQNSVLEPKGSPILVKHSPSSKNMSQEDIELSSNAISEINEEVKLNTSKSPQTNISCKPLIADRNISNSLLLLSSPKKNCISSNMSNKNSLNMNSVEFKKSVNETVERLSICDTSNPLISNNNHSFTTLDEYHLTTLKTPNKNSADDNECIISKNKEQKHLCLNTLSKFKMMPKHKEILKMKINKNKSARKFKKSKDFKNLKISITPLSSIRTISNCNNSLLNSNVVEKKELGYTNNFLLNETNSGQGIANIDKSKNNIEMDKTMEPMMNVTLDNNSQSHLEAILQENKAKDNLHTDDIKFDPSYKVLLGNSKSEYFSKKSSKCAIQIYEESKINLSQLSIPIDKSTFPKTVNTLPCSTNSDVNVINTNLNVTQKNSLNVQSRPSKPIINRNFSLSVNSDLSHKKISKSNIYKDKSVLCSNTSNRPTTAKAISSTDSQLNTSKSTGSIFCEEEVINKIIQFLEIKILQKYKNLTPAEQHNKAVSLAQTFVQNNVVAKLEKKTMKDLAEFASCNI